MNLGWVADLGMLIAAVFWAAMAAGMMLGASHEVDRAAAWFWGASFAVASLAAAWILETTEGDQMSLTAQELGVALFAVGLFASTTSVAVRAESKVGAWVSASAFFSFSLLAAFLLWRLI